MVFLYMEEGWKKLIEKEIDNTTFKMKVKDTIGIENL